MEQLAAFVEWIFSRKTSAKFWYAVLIIILDDENYDDTNVLKSDLRQTFKLF